MYNSIANAVVNDSFEVSPRELGSEKGVWRSTMTSVADADIIFECRIDESTGDSGETETEERRSCPVGIEFVGIGGDVANPEYSDDRWRGCFVDHLQNTFRLEVSEAHIVTYLDHPPTSVPEPAPIIGVPTPSPFPNHWISNGSLTPR